MPKFYYSPRTMYGDYSLQNKAIPFNVEEAKTLMLRPGSKLRMITLGGTAYSVSESFGHLSLYPTSLSFRENGCVLHLSETLVYKLRTMSYLKWPRITNTHDWRKAPLAKLLCNSRPSSMYIAYDDWALACNPITPTITNELDHDTKSSSNFKHCWPSQTTSRMCRASPHRKGQL